MISKDDVYNAILFIFLGIILGAVFCVIYSPSLTLFTSEEPSFDSNTLTNNFNNGVQLANPSATYCVDDVNGEYVIRTDENGSEHGICILTNLKEIGAWELFYVDHKICPQVCVSMWKLVNNNCVYLDCGSGCGPNNITTFESIEECESNLATIN